MIRSYQSIQCMKWKIKIEGSHLNKQDAQLSQRDHVMLYVSSSPVNCCINL